MHAVSPDVALSLAGAFGAVGPRRALGPGPAVTFGRAAAGRGELVASARAQNTGRPLETSVIATARCSPAYRRGAGSGLWRHRTPDVSRLSGRR